MKTKLFKDVNIGERIVFLFDNNTNWKYEKVEANKVKCLSCPPTENCVGEIENWFGDDKNVIVVE